MPPAAILAIPPAPAPRFRVDLTTVLSPVVLMLLVLPPTSLAREGYLGLLGAHLHRRPGHCPAHRGPARDGHLRFGCGFSLPSWAAASPRVLKPIASVVMIVGAGGGFNGSWLDGGTGDAIAKLAVAANLSVLVMGWLVAVLIRLATGSATVATVTAAGIVSELAVGLSPVHLALVVLAVGAGSLFFSHVNDAGFWLVKEYFGLGRVRNHQDLVGDGDHHPVLRIPRGGTVVDHHLAAATGHRHHLGRGASTTGSAVSGTQDTEGRHGW